MKLITIATSLGLGLSAAAALYLYQENQDLSARLRAAEEAPAPVCDEPSEKVVVVKETVAVPASQAQDVAASAPASQPNEGGRPRTWRERLERRRQGQAMMELMLGRHDGEDEDAYRARVAPFITDRLAEPRRELDAFRDEVFAEAKISEEQRSALDSAVQQAMEEAVDLTNRSITEGELSPYERNPSGVLELAGAMGAVLRNTEEKLNKILSPEQRAALDAAGFDWAEYLAVQTPWETLTPPPPRPK